MGQSTERIVSGTLAQLLKVDFGGPLHSLVIVGGTPHDIELAMITHYGVKEGDIAADYQEDFGDEWNGQLLKVEEEDAE